MGFHARRTASPTASPTSEGYAKVGGRRVGDARIRAQITGTAAPEGGTIRLEVERANRHARYVTNLARDAESLTRAERRLLERDALMGDALPREVARTLRVYR